MLYYVHVLYYVYVRVYICIALCQTSFSVLSTLAFDKVGNERPIYKYEVNSFQISTMSDSLKRIICCYIILQSSIISFFYALFVCLCVPLSVCLSDNQSVEFTPNTCESKGGANFGLITNSTAVYNPFKGKKIFYLHVAELSL